MNGVINLLKPPGMTSQDAVSHVKRILSVRKAGHAGTLDPGACGVLPVCVGRATKLARFISDDSKEYIAELTLGMETDTLDSYGMPVRQRQAEPVSSAALKRVLREMVGRQQQLPPAYSAVKKDGKPLYRYAREGRQVDVPPRQITVRHLELLRGFGTGPFLIRVDCSKGTYVRVLLSDIAAALGQVGCTTFLERTRVGRFSVQDACTFEELERAQSSSPNRLLISPEEASPGERLVLPSYLYEIIDSGAKILPEKVHGLQLCRDTLYSVYCRDTFFGVGEYDGVGLSLTARIAV